MRLEFLAPLFLAALVSSAAAAEIRVPQDQPTIQAAIDVAIADDVVVVSRGVYDENVSIVSRSDLTIEGRGAVVIRSTGTGLFIHASHNISVTGIAVKGGTIGIDVFESNDVTIQKFAVTGVTEEGVRADDSTDIRLLDGRVHGTGADGVLFGDSVGVTSCQITAVKVSKSGSDGIEAFGTNVLVSNCRVSGVEGDGFESQEGLSPVRFEQCKATRAEGDGFNMGAVGTVAVGCTAKKCGDDGFDVEGNGSSLEDCQAKGSRDRGFGIDDVDGVDVLSCSAVGCGGQGFELQNATNTQVEDCSAKKSGEEGFLLSGESSGNTLVGNEASKSGSFDLGDNSEGPNTFTDNRFRTISSN
jgi:parallel beta-helix repeat protein